jgi:hypothetical protein
VTEPDQGVGRPTDYTEEKATLICDLLCEGKSLVEICGLEGMPHRSTVFRWIEANEGFRNKYARAREDQAELMADQLLAIADDMSNDVSGELKMPNAVAVQRAKLQIDTRKWIASKLLPKKYGDRNITELQGKDGAELNFTLTRVGKK